MKKAMVNFWVDAVIGVAFLLCAVTGVVLLLPVGVRSVSASGPAIFGIGLATWRFVHDWSGVAMTAGVVVHGALHYRWIVNMSRRALGGEAAQRRGRRAPAAPRTAPGPALVPSPVAAKSSDGERRYSRGTFLAGLAGAAGAAALVGLAIGGSGGGSSVQSRQVARQSGLGGSGGDDGELDDGWSGGGSSQNGATGAQGGGVTTATSVAVDSAACVGCGQCLGVCPAGVFGWDGGGKAAAQNPDACIDCRRCLQACPAGAITVNA